MRYAAARDSIGRMLLPLKRRATRCALGIAVLAASTPAAPAVAAPRPTTAALAEVGVKVSWPTTKSTVTLPPATRFIMRVRPSKARGGAKVRLSVSRLGKKNTIARVIKRHKLARGRVIVTIPRTVGRRYAVTVTAGTLRSRTVVTIGTPRTAGAPGTPGTPGTPGSPTAPPPGAVLIDGGYVMNGVFCPDPSVASHFFHISAAAALPGEDRAYLIENTGTACLATTNAYTWSRLENGVWVEVPNVPELQSAPGVQLEGFMIGGGTQRAGSVHVPDNAAPGRYRVMLVGAFPMTISAELDVVAPPAP